MITEKQKRVIFDINCFYQLESQKEKLILKKPIEALPELSFVAILLNSNNESINWFEQYNNIYDRLKSYGFTEHWINTLKSNLSNFINNGETVESFREIFLTSIDILIDLLFSIISTMNPLQAENITKSVISDTFEKNYWEGEIVDSIIKIRMLKSILNFETKFVEEFGKVLVKNK